MRLLFKSLIICFIPALLLAQNGKIAGIVKEKYKGKALVDVQVKVIPSNRSTRSDSTGYFCIKKLAPGEYTVIFTKLGYLQSVLPAVRVHADSTTKLSIELDKVPPPVKDRLAPINRRIQPHPKIRSKEKK